MRARAETGFVVPLAAIVAQEVVGSFVWAILTEIFESEPEGDARPMPFSQGEGCGNAVYGGAIGTIGGVHAEYAEALARIDTVMDAAAACNIKGLGKLEVADLRKAMVQLLNQGVEAHVAGSLSPFPTGSTYYTCSLAKRPTRGQVRAWLGTLAARIGALCTDNELAAIAEELALPLDKPQGRIVGLSPSGKIAVGVAVVALGPGGLWWWHRGRYGGG